MFVKHFCRYLPLCFLLALLGLLAPARVLAATGLTVTVPASATPGTAFSVTVTTITPTGPDTAYVGTITFTSSDPTATLPTPYTFTPADRGAHTFTNGVTLKTAGNQTITVTSSDRLVGAATVAVSPAATTVALTSAPNPSAAGQPVTFNATVTSAGIAPTGTVTFKEGATTLGTGTVNGSGVATFTTSALAAGQTHTITAAYGDDANNAAGSGTTTQTVDAAGTSATKLQVTVPANATLGTAFDVTVTAQDAAGATDTGYTGTIHFTSSDPNAVLPADFTFTAGDAGTHTFTGGATLNSGGSQTITATDTTATTITGSGTVNVAPTGTANSATSVTSSNEPQTQGQPVTFTATVIGNAGTAPTGTVTFFDSLTGTPVAFGTVSLTPTPLGSISTATAKLTTSTLSVGRRQITAVYGGDANYKASTSAPIRQTINPIPTTPTITLTSSKNSAPFNTPVIFTVTVADPTGFGIPSGTVDFLDGTTVLNTNPIPLDANGMARFTTSSLALGNHPITARYNGDPTDPNGPGFYYTPGTSNVINELITGTNPANVVLASDTNPANLGDNITFTATISDPQNGVGGTPEGTVSFYDGTKLLGTVALPTLGTPPPLYAPAVANFSISTLAVGLHPITAVYSGDSVFAGKTSNVVPQRVGGTTVPNITLTANPATSPQTFGTSVTFTANVNGAGGAAVDGGTVSFFDGKTQIGGPVPVDTTNGQAAFTTSTLAIGTHPITAVYSGDDKYASVTSSVLNYKIISGPTATTLTLTSDNNPSLVGQTVNFTASVSGPPAQGETVVFKAGTLTLGTATLDNNGNATLPHTFNRAGTYKITATFAGDDTYKGSKATLTQFVNPTLGTSATFITSTPNPSSFGQAVTFTVTVIDATDPGSANLGLVTVIDRLTGTKLDQRRPTFSGPNRDGIYSFTYTFPVSTLSLGTHPITATYDGDDFNIGSRSGVLNQIVQQPGNNGRISVTSDINPSTFGQTVIFKATVQGTVGKEATGPITFRDAGIAIGTGVLATGPNGTATATFTTSALAIGAHPITADYPGDVNNSGGTSAVYEQDVSGVTPSSITLTANLPSPQPIGTSVTFTATVTGTAGGPTPTGIVRFFDTINGTTTILGNVKLNASGVATLTTAGLINGSHTIKALYLGDATYAFSSASIPYDITGGGTNQTDTALASSVNPSGFAQPVTFTATVTDASGGGGIPSGVVTFFDGNTVIGSGTLDNNGVATFTTAGLSVGTHPITAVYTGDTVYASSTSPILNQVVNENAPGTTLTSDINPSVLGQAVTFTATVTGNAPTGTVTFYDNGVPIGTGVLTTDPVTGITTATFTTSTLTIGVHPITAVYSGDANNPTSTSAEYDQIVETSVIPVGGTAGSRPASWPLFHAGGAPGFLPSPANPLFAQLQGTPTGVGTDASGNPIAVQIPPFVIGNYDPTRPPAGMIAAGLGVFAPNHFRDGTVLSWSAPYSFLRAPANNSTDLTDSPAPPPGFTSADITQDVRSQVTAINATDFPEITNAKYFGVLARSLDVPDPKPFTGSIVVTGRPAPANPAADRFHAIRQLVYCARAETIRVSGGGGGDVVRHVGAIYCLDGFTGGVVWRYQTPAVQIITEDANGQKVVTTRDPSSFSTPALARINVLTDPVAGTDANKLVVIVGDNNGFVYCLDAVGQGDGTSNRNAVDPVRNAPIYAPFGTLTPHVGNTQAYWIYRPDASKPKDTGTNTVRAPDPTRDVPNPQAFGTASPTVYIDPAVATNGATLTSNATVLIGNSNGTLYALDALGFAIDPANYATTGDKFNASIDLRPVPINAADPIIPTPQPKWWFTVRGTATDSNATIEGAPSIYIPVTPTGGGPQQGSPAPPTVYIGTSEELEAGSNAGRLYALDIMTGPKFIGLTTATAAPAPGGINYNVGQRSLWSFPNAWAGGPSGAAANMPARPALGNITGSPVVFSNPDAPANDPSPTRIYIAANVGPEVPYTPVTNPATVPRNSVNPRPALDSTGRIWAVAPDGTAAKAGTGIWSYPQALDPNDPASDTTPEPAPPIGAFKNATPAIGLVQFPKIIVFGAYPGTPYTHTDTTTGLDVTAAGRGAVPMLYVGTRGTDDKGFYALDIDGQTDTERDIYRIEAPTGTSFLSSPTLIANASTSGGNGGAVYATSGNVLYQFSATPITNLNANQAFPLINIDRSLTGFGPISAPSVATADVTDLNTFNAGGGTTPTPNGTDWVYVGDGVTGLARGITPADQLFGVGTQIGVNILPQDPEPPTIPDARYPLRLYLFDGTATHPGTSRDMRDPKLETNSDGGGPNPVNSTIAVFEWGQSAYIRIGNVVPPGFDPAHPDPNLLVQDPNDPTGSTFYGAGRDVSFQIADDAGAATTQIVRSTNPDGTPNIAPTLPANAFIQRKDTGRTQKAGESDEPIVYGPMPSGGETLKSTATPTGKGWVAAYTYPIGSGSTRAADTPGAHRHVTSATQTATRYLRMVDPSGNVFFSPRGAIVLQAVSTQGQTYTATDPITGQQVLKQTLPTIQPTFGILNPLAVRGGGIPLPLTLATPRNAQQIGNIDGLGPFRGVDPTMPAGSIFDFQALTNGNTVYVSQAPNSGYNQAGTNPTIASTNNAQTQANFPQAPYAIATSVGEISHGSYGDNGDPTVSTPPPTGSRSNAAANGLAATNYGPYALDAADRSNLGIAGDPGQPGGDPTLFPPLQISMQRMASHWNDNTTQGGPGSRINPLPWEDIPSSISSNASADYPNIPSKAISHSLHNATSNYEITVSPGDRNHRATPDPAFLPAGASDFTYRTVRPNAVEVRVNVPKHQPANLQLFDGVRQRGIAPTDPLAGNTVVATNPTFPQGYIEGGDNTQRIFVDINGNGRWDTNEPYREVQVYAGVPIDMTTRIANPTTDIGVVPQSFGIQVSQYPGLQDPLNMALGFSPYNGAFQAFFKPETVQNDGNVNLLNVHFDQKLLPVGGGKPDTLQLTSDPVDSTSFIQAFDLNGASGGLNYLVRSSLDTDIALRNPGIVGNSTWNALLPSATFHKPRVGPNPSTLTVPDAPEFGAAGYSLTPISSASDLDKVPDPTKGLKALPYVSVAVPLGTPVGAYSATLRLFEGYDPLGYTTYNGSGQKYDPLYPPQYNGAVGGQKTGQAYNGNDSLLLTQLPNGAPAPDLPYSEPGTTVKVTVQETRLTDGLSYGAIPQFDQGPSIPGVGTAPAKSAADYLPGAFRDFYWLNGVLKGTGDMSMYWTSTRAPNYNVYGANLPFHTATSNTDFNYFAPGNAAQHWWTPIGGLNPAGMLFPAGTTNTGLTIAQDQEIYTGSNFTSDGSAFAFLQNISAAAPFQNTLYCYPVNTANGTTGVGVAISSDPAQAKSGVRGLRVSGAGFPDNLWAFWVGGTRGRTALYYSSTTASPGTVTWTPHSFVLPITASLTSVSDPAPVLVQAPVMIVNPDGSLSAPKLGPVIEVTYSGVGPDGTTDLYLSRYLPQMGVNGQPTTLAPVPFPASTEKLVPDTRNNWYSARDTAWLRSGALDILFPDANGNNLSILRTGGVLNAGIKVSYDKASGQWVFTNVALPANVLAQSLSPGTVPVAYVDLLAGRVRFNVALKVGTLFYATFNSQARRITAANPTEGRANTNPTAFVDETFKPSMAGFNNDANKKAGNPVIPPVKTDRYWFLWRKSGVTGDRESATIYVKSQRLTVVLPVPIKLDAQQKPTITVTDSGGNTLYAENTGGIVDVDGANGRLYFPVAVGNTSWLEGQTVTATYTGTDGKPHTINDAPVWADEPRLNDTDTTKADVTEFKLKLNQIVNESNVSAFLDPLAYGNVPGSALSYEHKIWLDWTSTRNGTADIYYETINPRF